MKRLIAVPLFLAALFLVARANPQAAAQDSLARRVAEAADGTVGMSYAVRPNVCGDGRTFIGEKFDDPGHFNVYTMQGVSFGDWNNDVRGACVHGPARVIIELRGGKVVDVRPYVGGTRELPARTELGQVSPAQASAYLVTLARAGDDFASYAILAAAIAADSRITPTLFTYAEDSRLSTEVREAALKWIGRAAEREGTIERAVEVTRTVMMSSVPISVRERAVRVAGELPGGDRIVRGVYPRLTNSEIRERAIRVIAETGGAENARFVEQVATDADEPIQVRERALRLLGEELGSLATLRSLYARLDDETLQERIVRSVGENGTAEDIAWLRRIALDASQRETVRERAIRIIGEQQSTTTLREMFDRLDNYSLRERIVRIVAEKGSREDHAWLEQIATGDGSSDLRERAVRSLSDAGVSSTRLATLFDRSTDSTVRERLVRILIERADDAAVVKLREIARNDPDADLRERARKGLGGR